MMDSPEILTESMVASPGWEPFVAMRWGDEAAQFTPDEARVFALTILATAEAAEHDSAFCRYLEVSGVYDRQAIGAMLAGQRVHRGTRRTP